MNQLENSNLDKEEKENLLISSVDAVTRRRAGSLSAHGLSEPQIADILLLSLEQVLAIKVTEEYRLKYADEADRAIQAQIDRDEGWDAVEEKSLEVLMETLKFNRDPKFALLAAKTANSAKRKDKTVAPHIVDATQSSAGTTNIIVLQLNKTYTDGATQKNSMIDVSPRSTNIPQRQSDLPSPKLVENMLAPIKALEQKPMAAMSDLERAFHDAGVVFDKNEME